MKRLLAVLGLASLPILGAVTPAGAQATTELRATTYPGELELIAPSPGTREVTRPREADFYREDIRVRHDPGFVEPLTARPKSGPIKKIGLSGWTAPPGVVDRTVQREASGWFGFGLSFTWE